MTIRVRAPRFEPPLRPVLGQALQLVDLLRTARLSLLLGPAGAGKSTLLRQHVLPLIGRRVQDGPPERRDPARVVVPLLERRGRSTGAPPQQGIEIAVYFDGWGDAPLESLAASIDAAAAWLQPGLMSTARSGLAAPLADAGRRRGARFLIVLDGFEQHLAQPPQRDDIVEFDEALIDALNRPFLPVHFLLVLRDEASPWLARLRARIARFDDHLLRFEAADATAESGSPPLWHGHAPAAAAPPKAAAPPRATPAAMPPRPAPAAARRPLAEELRGAKPIDSTARPAPREERPDDAWLGSLDTILAKVAESGREEDGHTGDAASRRGPAAPPSHAPAVASHVARQPAAGRAAVDAERHARAPIHGPLPTLSAELPAAAVPRGARPLRSPQTPGDVGAAADFSLPPAASPAIAATGLSRDWSAHALPGTRGADEPVDAAAGRAPWLGYAAWGGGAALALAMLALLAWPALRQSPAIDIADSRPVANADLPALPPVRGPGLAPSIDAPATDRTLPPEAQADAAAPAAPELPPVLPVAAWPRVDLGIDATSGDARIAFDLAQFVAPLAGIALNPVPGEGWAQRLQSGAGAPLLSIAHYDALYAARQRPDAAALRVIAPLLIEPVGFAVRADSPLRYIHQLKGRRINVGAAGSGRALTATTIYQRLFGGAGLPAAPAGALDQPLALQELRQGGGLDAVAMLGDAPLGSGLRLLQLDRSQQASRRALQSFLPATLGNTPTLGVMSFLVTHETRDPAQRAQLAEVARALCSALPALQRHGDPRWRQLRAGLELDAGWPALPEAQAAWRACGHVPLAAGGSSASPR